MVLTGLDKSVFSKYPIDYFGEIWDKLSPLPFDKKTVLPVDVLCFLQQGTVRKSVWNEDKAPEADISVDFYFEGDIFTAKAGDPVEDQFVYRPIGRGILWYVEMDEVRKLFAASKLCGTVQKVFLEEQLRLKILREIQLLKASPREIYAYLLKNKPLFLQKVPLKYLASYIGVTPQALSRIRKQIY